ncbi:WecB/TagA/CpsF family glycosyltransferase [Leptolyngbya cf. ectocarpi LEGE 11479]|uniref:WecB/TagA/CpsF family glycosyltransferase n=1 Tax=Leptolyngbya cf. ectocarpi LEGE 11479 TaxID=1828722 RepID=A0A928ZSL5_LEPEC|nr:WecB/TagA/CpsF family glycosyltransferase [Leptolyngbya ectocarpi]MBE9065396.1 WecB/TagA/CpsF family glycosyltransferase [Leptolyngbya cf. ectocarpi LEGE 11479]
MGTYTMDEYRIAILGVFIDATSYGDVCDRISQWTTTQQSCYIVAANVHVVMTAYWNPDYRQILNHAALVTPDGMPLVWGLRRLGVTHQPRVYGPDLMLAWCDRATQEQRPIYLYGGTDTMVQRLAQNLQQQFPGLIIAGSHAPPFRALTPAEEAADVAAIRQSGAAVVFVGLGCPKQEEWMARQQGKLNAVMIGVGAAFSFHSGTVSQAPRWMMAWGLEWAYRLWQEPRRLWRRYVLNNSAFLLLFGLQLINQAMRSILKPYSEHSSG